MEFTTTLDDPTNAPALPESRRRPRSQDIILGTRPTPEALRAADGHPLEGVRVVLAPLCGITDSVFRKICLDHGADMVVTEMISADGLVRNSPQIRAVDGLDMSQGPLSLQIFGSDADAMGEAAAHLSELEPRFLDMNFGCPVRKIVNRNGGSAVLKDLKLLYRICRAVVEKSTVPVSAKIRSGWDRPTAEYLHDIGRAIEDAGVSMVAVHARTKKQAFAGKANYGLIRAIKEAVSIPVIGNGDVVSPEAYFRMKEESGCDAVMIGRGAIGNPWIFEEIKAAIDGRDYTPPTPEERVAMLLHHLRLAVEKLGEPTGVVLTRKIMAAYLKRLPNARELRGHVMKCHRVAELEALFDGYLRRLDGSDDGAEPDAVQDTEFEAAC
jgi:tRNA-dihydrouridine synthase B